MPPGAAGAAEVGDYVDIAARHKEVAGARFDKAHWRTQVLNLSRIG